MTNWYDKACEGLDEDYDNGLLNQKDYQAAMRDLDAEYRQEVWESICQNALKAAQDDCYD